MVKAKVKLSKSKKPVDSFKVIATISLIFNAVVLVVLILGAIFEKYGVFDYAIVNTGITHACSSQFRTTAENDSKKEGDSANETKLKLAVIDYPCEQNGARQYYADGFNSYADALGIKQ